MIKTKKIVYITAQIPWGRGETFIIDEMLSIKELGLELLIIPRNPSREVFHNEAKSLLQNALWLPLLNLKMLGLLFVTIFSNYNIRKIIKELIKNSRNFNILFKNLIVLPKGIYASFIIKNEDVHHIHAHWGSTTSTMAWIISEITGIPWSMTLHRWDIKENNMLKLKLKNAVFARCISNNGKNEVLSIVGSQYKDKIKVLHMGVKLPKKSLSKIKESENNFEIACPANLLPVKGHKYLVDACYILFRKGFKNIRCLIIGEGPLEKEISKQISTYGLEKAIRLTGYFSHDKLMKMYEKGEIQAVILPSIVTKSKEHEGIPISLMEAMSYGIPVVSTETGAIPELIGDGSGIMVPEKDAVALANAIENLIKDECFREKVGKQGRMKIKREFNIKMNVKLLINYSNLKNGIMTNNKILKRKDGAYI